jgi:hypothetical protein
LKILGYILLSVALVGGALSGYLWRYHTKQAHLAAAQEQDALSDASEWETSEALGVRNDEAHLTADQLRLRNDNMEVEIAELEGHSAAPARSRVSKDERLISADEMVLKLGEDARAFGPSSHVRTAQQAGDGAHTRLVIATSWISRDERFLYFSVGLLVLSGFAFGFAANGNRRGIPLPS